MPRTPPTRDSELRRKTLRTAEPAASPSAPASSREKVGAHRRRMRAKGFRLVQLWVPDTRAEVFTARARAESAALAAHPAEADDQAFVDAVSWLTDADTHNCGEPTDPEGDWWRRPEPAR